MATANTHTGASLTSGVLQLLAAPFRALGRGILHMGENNYRLKRVKALQAKTDAELAEMGLKREEIVRYVFEDTFYV